MSQKGATLATQNSFYIAEYILIMISDILHFALISNFNLIRNTFFYILITFWIIFKLFLTTTNYRKITIPRILLAIMSVLLSYIICFMSIILYSFQYHIVSPDLVNGLVLMFSMVFFLAKSLMMLYLCFILFVLSVKQFGNDERRANN